MKWDHFLAIVNAIRAKSFGAKLDLFFQLMDADGNGLLSWEEVTSLCKMTISRLINTDDKDFIEDISTSFAKFIFQAMNVEPPKEIPISFMIKSIKEESEEVDLLLMMCCAEKITDDQLSLEEQINEEEINLLKDSELEYKLYALQEKAKENPKAKDSIVSLINSVSEKEGKEDSERKIDTLSQKYRMSRINQNENKELLREYNMMSNKRGSIIT